MLFKRVSTVIKWSKRLKRLKSVKKLNSLIRLSRGHKTSLNGAKLMECISDAKLNGNNLIRYRLKTYNFLLLDKNNPYWIRFFETFLNHAFYIQAVAKWRAYDFFLTLCCGVFWTHISRVALEWDLWRMLYWLCYSAAVILIETKNDVFDQCWITVIIEMPPDIVNMFVLYYQYKLWLGLRGEDCCLNT